jgi:hypothetical protein
MNNRETYQSALLAEIVGRVNARRGEAFTCEDAEAAALARLLVIDDSQRLALLERGRDLREGLNFDGYCAKLNAIRRVSELLSAAKECGIIDQGFPIGEHPSMDAVYAEEIRERGWSPFYASRARQGGGWVEELAPDSEKITAMQAALASLDAK